MAKLLGVGDVTVTRYETKQIQDEAHDKIMRLIDENALIALEYLEINKKNFKKGQRYEIIKNNIKAICTKLKKILTIQFVIADCLKRLYINI